MFQRYETHTSMSAAEVTAVLMRSVSRPPWFRRPKTPFVGSVSEGGFRIVRVVPGQDSFNPMLYGRMRQDPAGSTVYVTATLHPIVWTFMTIWSTALTIAMWRDSNPPHGAAILFALLFILAPWLMAAAFFPSSAAKSRALLESCIHSPAANPNGA